MSVEPKQETETPENKGCVVRLYLWWWDSIGEDGPWDRKYGEVASILLMIGGVLLMAAVGFMFVLPVLLFALSPLMVMVSAWWHLWMHLINLVTASH